MAGRCELAATCLLVRPRAIRRSTSTSRSGRPSRACSPGALGQQDLAASIARASQAAAPYQALSNAPVIPAFEIIATIAQACAGSDGDYSYESTVASLRPWVRQATAVGMYVILDLQAGRASLLAQARRYRSLLELPGVGLALDPEWKLQPGQRPLRQIDIVSISEVNGVISRLTGLTARYRLPPEAPGAASVPAVDDPRRAGPRYPARRPGHPHPHGRAARPGQQAADLGGRHRDRPGGEFFGRKDFYVKDHPMLGPRQTMARTPRLSMISYQ